ncbi:hypothetical protein TPR58_17245 [Sphingomonas sp. HF-S3]|uniref:Uncharacterized protein n=1 Tax=Sphingomonas rustica TaxID=3103142 RepID=A0ABV0BBJ2_9SPHN
MSSAYKPIIAISLMSAPIWAWLFFERLFASCYIDDGCGRIDPFVPVIVTASAIVAAVLTGWLLTVVGRAGWKAVVASSR